MAVEGQRMMTKTQHYRKVTKPLLERKRRARMNLYLDELKDLIVDTMETQGDHVNKLEKADILEMTVSYLKSRKHKMDAARAPRGGEAAVLNVEKFRAGYTQAAYEVSKVFATLPGVDLKFGARLMKQLAYQLKDIPQASPSNGDPHRAAGVGVAQPINGFAQSVVAQSVVAQPVVAQPPRKSEDNRELQPLDLQAHSGDVWRPW